MVELQTRVLLLRRRLDPSDFLSLGINITSGWIPLRNSRGGKFPLMRLGRHPKRRGRGGRRDPRPPVASHDCRMFRRSGSEGLPHTVDRDSLNVQSAETIADPVVAD
jgi:hypothetical protein